MTTFDLGQLESVKGKVVVVTGSNSGIGFEIARIISSFGAHVILACRNETRGLEAQRRIKGNSEYFPLDLASFQSIENFASEVKNKFLKVDILINNAGVLFPPFTRTEDDLELTFGVNCIGYYYLSLQLIPLLNTVDGSRVVNMSSISQYRVRKIDWESINSEKKYNRVKSYALSNLFRTMYSIELEDRLRAKNYQTISLSCHPGVTLTNLYKNLPKILNNSFLAKVMNNTVYQTPYKSAMPAIMAAFSCEVRGGDFVGLDSRFQFRGKPKIVQPNILAFEKDLRERLWKISAEITSADLY